MKSSGEDVKQIRRGQMGIPVCFIVIQGCVHWCLCYYMSFRAGKIKGKKGEMGSEGGELEREFPTPYFCQ